MPTLLKLALCFIHVCLVVKSGAAPLKIELSPFELHPVEDDRDNTYGPWEKNSWSGNEHPDDIHRDDLWPPLVNPRAALWHGPTSKEKDAAISELAITATTSGKTHGIEIHTDSYSPPPTDASSHPHGIVIHGASGGHWGAILPRALHLFQPLEDAYTWLNDIYDTVLRRHPHFHFNDPAQNINGCIYYPSPDRAAILGKVICPPDKDHK